MKCKFSKPREAHWAQDKDNLCHLARLKLKCNGLYKDKKDCPFWRKVKSR